jgi:hypothetical protein
MFGFGRKSKASGQREWEYARVEVALFPFEDEGDAGGNHEWSLSVPPRKALLRVGFVEDPTDILKPGAFVHATLRFLGGDKVPRHKLRLDGVLTLLRDGETIGTVQIEEWCEHPPAAKVDWQRDAPAAAEKLVALCSTMGIQLDYSPASLRHIDTLLGAGSGGEDSSALLLMAGCYVGEVFVRHLGGSWTLAEPKDTLPSVKLPNGGLCNPMGKVVKLHRNGEGDSVAFFFSGVRKVLEDRP